MRAKLANPATERTHREAIELLCEARDYLEARRPRNRVRENLTRGGERSVSEIAHTLETTRVTARLSSIVAWTMVQRAVANGRVPRSTIADPDNRLQGRDVCLDNPAATNPDLPLALRELCGKSHALYLRVARLDALLDQPVEPHPIHRLDRRDVNVG